MGRRACAERKRIRRPFGLRVRVGEHNWGRFTSPPPPSALGPLAAKVEPDRLKRTLYVYWGLTLVRKDQIRPL